MKIVTSRDIKNNPNILFEEGAESVITSRGRPKAVCIALEKGDYDHIENLLSALRLARTKISLEKLRAETFQMNNIDRHDDEYQEKINVLFEEKDPEV